MSDKPLISLIVSCYNQERFIAEALDGVFAQTYRPLEILVLDDCSTDRSAAIAAAKIAENSRQNARLLVGAANLGTRGNLLRGIDTASGRFIAVACGDDILYPDAISEVARVWQEENVTLVNANAEYIDDDSRLIGRTYRDPDERADDSFETMARDGVNACCFGPFLCFERELLETFGVPEDLEVFDIIAPFYAYLLKGARFIDRPLFRYRVHGGNQSHSLLAEQLGGLERLRVEEHMKLIHLAHAVHARDTLRRLSAQQPERYRAVEKRIAPLLEIQLAESARKLISARRELDRAQVTSETVASGHP